MDWVKLLSVRRLGKSDNNTVRLDDRSQFRKDGDRIMFSSAFRRMQDKTQVYSTSRSDYVRTRLTHSLEVSVVGRSLGLLVGKTLCQRYPEINKAGYLPGDIADLVHTACLAHDIGNPPFGHSGETSIQDWFKGSLVGQVLMDMLPANERDDFYRFEGNAQGFRILTRLANPDRVGGLQLTCGVLGTFTKYPKASDAPRVEGHASTKKHGFFLEDKPFFIEVMRECGIPERSHNSWQRHPMVFLMEAADDICYRIVDIEDGFRSGRLSFDETFSTLAPLVDGEALNECGTLSRDEKKIEFLRARGIHFAIRETVEAFLDSEKMIREDRMDHSLVDDIPMAKELGHCQDVGEARLYPDLLPSTKVLIYLIENMGQALVSEISGQALSPVDQALLNLLPKYDGNIKHRILDMTDFLSGMTDRYAEHLELAVRNGTIVSPKDTLPLNLR